MVGQPWKPVLVASFIKTPAPPIFVELINGLNSVAGIFGVGELKVRIKE
jgi:hypothetical protein